MQTAPVPETQRATFPHCVADHCQQDNCLLAGRLRRYARQRYVDCLAQFLEAPYYIQTLLQAGWLSGTSKPQGIYTANQNRVNIFYCVDKFFHS